MSGCSCDCSAPSPETGDPGIPMAPHSRRAFNVFIFFGVAWIISGFVIDSTLVNVVLFFSAPIGAFIAYFISPPGSSGPLTRSETLRGYHRDCVACAAAGTSGHASHADVDTFQELPFPTSSPRRRMRVQRGSRRT